MNQFCAGGAAKCGCTVVPDQVDLLFQQSVATRYLLWPPPAPNWANCSNTGGASKAAIGAKVGLRTAAAVDPEPISKGILAIASLFTGVFAHHGQMVKAQNASLCNAVPQVNAQLQQIDQQLAAGALTPAQASAQYASLAQQFTAAMKAGTAYKKCDALYAYDLAMKMVVAARNQDLQARAATAGGAFATATGLPPAALWIALGAAALLLL